MVANFTHGSGSGVGLQISVATHGFEGCEFPFMGPNMMLVTRSLLEPNGFMVLWWRISFTWL